MASTLEILDTLVGFDTTSSRSNLGLVDWVVDYLAGHGVKSTVLPDETGTKANLVARIGPEVAGGVVLCGHTDVVPVEGQPWTRPPFTLTREGSRVYGRGTTDMKGYLASVLAAVPAFAEAPLQVPLTLAFSHDEEVGCLGAPALAAHLLEAEPLPAAVMIGEPTSMRVVRAHKGVRVMRTVVTGRDVHSSRTDQGASAIMAMARLVSFIEELARDRTASGVRVEGFEPSYTTMNVGTISGGQALNIVPRHCEIVWEYRFVPGEDVDGILKAVEDHAADLLADLQRVAPEASISTQVLASIPVLDPAGNGGAADLLTALGLGAAHSVAFGTDGSTLQAQGLPTVVCGPGSMDQGHQPDEFIEVSELDRCDAALLTLRDWAAAG